MLKRVKKGDYWYKVRPGRPREVQAELLEEVLGGERGQRRQVRRRPRDLRPEGRRRPARCRTSTSAIRSRRSTRRIRMAACKMAWNFDAANSMGERPGRDLHAQRHRQQRRVQAHQAVAAHHGVPRPPRRPDRQPREPARHRADQRARAAGRRRRRRSDQAHQRLDVAGQGLVLRARRPAACAASTPRRAPIRSPASTSSPTTSTATAARSSTTSGS